VALKLLLRHTHTLSHIQTAAVATIRVTLKSVTRYPFLVEERLLVCSTFSLAKLNTFVLIFTHTHSHTHICHYITKCVIKRLSGGTVTRQRPTSPLTSLLFSSRLFSFLLSQSL